MKIARKLVVDKDIYLKEIGLKDAPAIFKTIDTEREYMGEWLPFVEDTLEISYTRRFIEGYINSEKTDLTCAIYFQDKFVGLIGLKDTDQINKKTEIGYWLSESFQHQGIVTRSCQTLINYAFDNMNMNRIQIKAATDNLKSRRVSERLGFKNEGIERDGELHSRGFVDLVVYSLLKADR